MFIDPEFAAALVAMSVFQPGIDGKPIHVNHSKLRWEREPRFYARHHIRFSRGRVSFLTWEIMVYYEKTELFSSSDGFSRVRKRS